MALDHGFDPDHIERGFSASLPSSTIRHRDVFAPALLHELYQSLNHSGICCDACARVLGRDIVGFYQHFVLS